MTDARSRIGLIGCGYWGRNLARVLRDLGVLAAVCDATPAGRETAARLAPEARIFAEPDAFLDADLDGVVVATPAATHFEVGLRVLGTGRDLFVEKPLALTCGEGRILVDEARRRGRMLMVGHVLEYHPAIVRLREIVDGGGLGRLQYVYSHRLNLGKVRREENVLWSFAPHDLAVIVRLAGEMPARIAACGATYLRPDVADITVTNLEFPSGVRAHVHVSWLHPFKEQRLVVLGSERMASYDDVAKRLVLYDRRAETRGDVETQVVHGPEELVPFAGDEPLRLECEAFVRSVRTRVPPLTDGTSALRVLRVLEASERSMRGDGRFVSPAEEEPT